MSDTSLAPSPDSTTTTTGGSPTPAPDGIAAAITADAPKPADTPKPDAPRPGPPETYADWTLPEGYKVDAEAMAEVTPVFKELGLTQEQGQKLMDLYAKNGLKTAEANMAAWQKTRADWRTELKTDPEIGKLTDRTGNFSASSPLVQTINDALNGLQNPKLVTDFKAAMDLTGAGDNPAFVKVLHALAKQVTEGTTHVTGGPTNANRRPASAGAALFPNLPSAQGS